MRTASCLAALVLAYGCVPACAQTTCAITFSINSYPSVRRSGTAENGYVPHNYNAIWDSFGASFFGSFVSDATLQYVSIIRTTPADVSFFQFMAGVSNATGGLPSAARSPRPS